jgi:hypothetical protein
LQAVLIATASGLFSFVTTLGNIMVISTLIKKEKKIFLIFKEIQKGAVAKSYMRKGFQIYEEMRKYLVIYEEAFSHI